MESKPSTPMQQEWVNPSFFCTIASRESKQLLSRQEFERLVKFDAMVKARTEDYRKQMLVSKRLAEQTKLMMPGITASAVMDGRGKALSDFVEPAFLIMQDFDNVDPKLMEQAIGKARKDPYVAVEYITTSGRGFRLIVKYLPLEDDDVTVLELFDVMVHKVMDHFEQLLGIKPDEQCVDITRMCGIAHDPDAYFNWDSKPFELNAHDLKVLYTKKAKAETYAKRSRKSRKPSQKMVMLAKGIPSMEEAAPAIGKKLEGWGLVFESERHNEYVCKFGQLCVHYGIDKSEALQYATDHFSADYPPTADVMESCYKHTELLGSWHLYRKGEGYSSHPSAKAIKQWLGERYEFHKNEVTGYYEIRSRNVQTGRFPLWTKIDDYIENSLWCEMDEDGFCATIVKLHSIINSDFSESWDPLDDYLRSLEPWDGKRDYIEELADRIQVAYVPGYEHTQELFRYYFKKWFVAMVVAWVSPKVVNQTIMILVGRGGIFKTTLLNCLLPPCLRQYFINDSTACYTDKDFMEAFSSKALICLDEMETAFGKSLSAFKSNVTKLVFSIRRPYDKYRSEMLHRAALCGTSNSQQIISDDENRRYSPWLVESIESPLARPIDYDHVYAQAVALGKEVVERQARHEDGWVYWLTTNDIEQMKLHNRMFMVSNFMEDQILRYFRVPKPDTDPRYIKFRYSSEIMERIGGSPALNRNLAQQNLASVMTRLGFKKVHKAQGNGWAVIEKDQGEINTDSVYDPRMMEDDAPEGPESDAPSKPK